MKIVFVNCKMQEKFRSGIAIDENADLLAFLKEKGLDITAVIWNDKEVNWKDFDVVIIKSPWDYHEHIVKFTEWLDMLNKLDLKVLNPVDVLKWNSNKHYLKQLENDGLKVTPSEYQYKGSSIDELLFEKLGKDKLVVKPCVSAGAKNTVIINREKFSDQSEVIDELLKEEDFIVQPFIDEIIDGEWSYLFFNGDYSHCVLKTPKKGDFRVQHFHGGSVSYPTPAPLHIDQAKAYLRTLSGQPLYARVDGVVRNGSLELMELELIEPYLYLNGDYTLMENYYRALMTQIS